MATTPDFKYAPMFQMGKDDTEYYLLTKDYVSVGEFEGKPILKVEAEGLTKIYQRLPFCGYHVSLSVFQFL